MLPNWEQTQPRDISSARHIGPARGIQQACVCEACEFLVHRDELVKRALFAWLIADGDMHLKNMAVLKTAEPGDQTFRSVRLAPLYDAVTTHVFPALEHDRMALKLNGKDDRLRRADFRALSSTVGLRVSDADAAIDAVLEKLRLGASCPSRAHQLWAGR
jgi:serine/threonine protein kinase HipA of HipAB toxin-antitoxin module